MDQRVPVILNMLNAFDDIELVSIIAKASALLQARYAEVESEFEAEPTAEPQPLTRQYLPRMGQLIEWGLVAPLVDKIYIQGHDEQPALLLDPRTVAYRGETVSINDWAKQITGWRAINVYEWVVVAREGKTLATLRAEYMQAHGLL